MMGQSENLGILPGGFFSDLLRHQALGEHADDLAARALAAPPGEDRDEMAAEALAARARMLELERGAA